MCIYAVHTRLLVDLQYFVVDLSFWMRNKACGLPEIVLLHALFRERQWVAQKDFRDGC